MFIQPCFIINNKERREKLQSLGVRYDGYYGVDNKFILTGYGPYDNFYDTVDNPPISVNYHTKNDGYQSFEYLNCADNEELFFALATLRDDTSINQYYWFNDRLFKCEGLEFDRVLKNNTANYLLRCRCVNKPMILSCFKERNLKKATVEELIGYFNK